MISAYEISPSSNIAQTTQTEKFSTWYSIYMKAGPREQVKVLTVQNAS